MNKYFIDVIRNHYADFSGKATRTQFWLWVLWYVFFAVLLLGLSMILPILGILLFVMAIGLLVPNVAIVVRRLRDGGFSPYLAFLMLPYYISNLLGHLPDSVYENIGTIGAISILFSGLVVLVCNIALLVLMCLPSKSAE